MGIGLGLVAIGIYAIALVSVGILIGLGYFTIKFVRRVLRSKSSEEVDK